MVLVRAGVFILRERELKVGIEVECNTETEGWLCKQWISFWVGREGQTPIHLVLCMNFEHL